MTIQCPTYPYLRASGTYPGIAKPMFASCGLSMLDAPYFDGFGSGRFGLTGTDLTCCFESVRENCIAGDCCTGAYFPGDSRQYEYDGYRYCQDIRECLGNDRMAWPFWSGAGLVNARFENYKEPEETGAATLASRLPAIDIRSIPQVLSPFTGKTYCETSNKDGLPVNHWGVPTLCGSDMTRFLSNVAGSRCAVFASFVVAFLFSQRKNHRQQKLTSILQNTPLDLTTFFKNKTRHLFFITPKHTHPPTHAHTQTHAHTHTHTHTHTHAHTHQTTTTMLASLMLEITRRGRASTP